MITYTRVKTISVILISLINDDFMRFLIPFLFFISGPFLGFFVTWILCLGAKPDNSTCFVGAMFRIPLFSVIGVVLSISSLIYYVKKGNQNTSSNIPTTGTPLNTAINTTNSIKPKI